MTDSPLSLLLVLALAPPLILLYRVYKLDKIEREPPKLIAKLFLFGVLSTIPAVILELLAGKLLDNLTGFISPYSYFFIFLENFFGVALIEELVKYAGLKWGSWKHPAFDYCFDGVVYAVTTSLGFAALENVLYVTNYGISNALTRAVLSIPGHCIFGIFMGYYYGMAKYGAVHGFTAKSKHFLRMAIIVPMTLHGIYDFCLSTGSDVFTIIFFVYVIALDIFAFRSIRKFSRSDTSLM